MPDVLPISEAVAQARWRPGDILAFYGAGWSSRLIELATWGPSHVGIICEWPLPEPTGGYSLVDVLVESTTLCQRPCIETGRYVDGVQVQLPRQRIEDYVGRARLYRLADHWQLDQADSDHLSELLSRWIGKPYDYRGALWSGTRVLKYLPRMPYSDLGSLFCSELIAASLQRLGRLCVTNAGYFNPGSLVRALVKSGVYLPGVPV